MKIVLYIFRIMIGGSVGAVIPVPNIEPMAGPFWSTDHPPCCACVEDEIYDRTGRHPRAAVRVEICREPYVLRLCEPHLDQLVRALPPGGVWVVERYQSSGRSPDEHRD